MAEEWMNAPLGSVGTWMSGGTPSKQNAGYWDGPIPWVSPKDMKRSRLADAIDHVSRDAVGNGTQLAPPGSLLMVVRGMILAHTFPVARAEKPLAFNQDVKALVPGAAFESDFLLYWLQSQQSDVLRMVDVANHGTKRLASERLFAMLVPRPPLPEQKKIAAILSSVDDTIEATQAVIDQLKVVKNAMMAELLTQGLPGRHKKFKMTEIGEVPEAWDVVLLDSVARRGSGHTPNKHHPEYWDGEIKWVSLKDSSSLDQLYISDTAAHITPLGIANSSATEHPAGTVVLSRDAGVGKSAITTDVMAVSQHFMAWTCGPRLDSHFLYYLLQLKKPDFERIAIGSTIKTIGLPYFKKLLIQVPPLAEQQLVAAALTAIDLRIFAEEATMERSRGVKSALMSVLLTGEVRVKPEEAAA